MSIRTSQRNEIITYVLNGTLLSLKQVISLNYTLDQPKIGAASLHLNFGVLIGITGDVKGKLILSGDTGVFSTIGQSMFEATIENEMIPSFSGELGNMIAGGLATNIVNQGLTTDITYPTILEGDTIISGFKQAIELKVIVEKAGNMHIYLCLE